MRTIKESFDVIIERQKELNYHMEKILRPPASMENILITENNLNFVLNNELKELYSCADGIENDFKTASGLIGLIPIHEFMSLKNSLEYYKVNIAFEDSFLNWDTNFKPGKKLFPFLQDGAGNCYWVDLNNRTKNFGEVFWTNTFGDNPCYVFHSLTTMFHIISESYLKNIFWIDTEGYLDCDFNAFDDLTESFKK